MIAMQVARIVADVMIFLSLSDEERLDADEAVEMMEVLGRHLDNFDRSFLRGLVDAFPVIAAEYGDRAQEAVRDIPYSFNLEETLASDNPVRLAELEAIREARH